MGTISKFLICDMTQKILLIYFAAGKVNKAYYDTACSTAQRNDFENCFSTPLKWLCFIF